MKIMKRLAYISVVFSLVFLLSCDVNDLLREEPRDIFNPDLFFNSDEDAIAAVNGVYADLKDFNLLGGGPNLFFWQHGTDLTTLSGGRESNFPQHVYTLSAGNATDNFVGVDIKWRGLYRSVGDANVVINRVSEAENVSDVTKARVVGEAKFLRAYFYYWLTNLWGDVPLWTDELEIEAVNMLPRTSVEEVRDQMVSDLLDAEESLPVSYSGDDRGRASRWAAKMLLTKVYLWQEEWAKARDVADDIIVNSPHRLLDEYRDIFNVENEENEFNDENIWELSFVRDIHTHNDNNKYKPRQGDEVNVPLYDFVGFGLITVADEFVNSFHPEDKRLPINAWNGTEEVKTNFYYNQKMIDWDAPRGNSGVNQLIFRLADAYLMFAEAENELNGPTPQAYERINAIRNRAEVQELSGLTQEEFREAIMDERKWELAFEHHRRWDLIRWGKLVEAVQTMTTTNPQGAANIQSHHRLAPIPPNEINKNPNLEQNPGY